jgi:hypothetical protein
MIGYLWLSRKTASGMVIELRAGDRPALVLTQVTNRIRIDLTDVRLLAAAWADGAAELAELLVDS